MQAVCNIFIPNDDQKKLRSPFSNAQRLCYFHLEANGERVWGRDLRKVAEKQTEIGKEGVMIMYDCCKRTQKNERVSFAKSKRFEVRDS